MDNLSILFWTMVALLAVLMFAVEAGAARRHRLTVMCTVVSTLASILFIMFLVEDRTQFDIAKVEPPPKKRGNRGAAEFGGGSGEGTAEKPSANSSSSSSGTSDAELGRTFTDCAECPVMVRVKPGRFTMGSPPEEAGRSTAEGPQRQITVGPEFAVSRFPVTRQQFQAFVEETEYEVPAGCVVDGKWSAKHSWKQPGFEQGGNHPVVCVTLADGLAYVKWLETKTAKSYRLLSEAEWEYMARGNTITPYWYGPTINASDFNTGRTRDGTVPVGVTPGNDFDLFDVHGNVSQLVEDCWTPTLEAMPSNGDPHHSRVCRRGVIRGGNWASSSTAARSAVRSVLADVKTPHNTVGLRVAREVAPRKRSRVQFD